MTSIKKTLAYSHESESHFLFSKTDTGGISELKPEESIDADEVIKSAFPDLRSGIDFIDYANQQLAAIDNFIAMVIRRDPGNQDGDRADLPDEDGGHVDVAGIIDERCRKENGLWGRLETGLFGSFFPEKNGSDGLGVARDIQAKVLKKTARTVTIGLASFPTLTYQRSEIITNARKALDHATFFGASSLTAFDDVSLNISGDKFYEKGNLQAAINEFKLALELDPNNVNVHNSLGVCYGLQSQYDAAIAEFKQVIAMDPDEYMALYNLGLVHLLTDQPDRALGYFLDAGKINPDNYEVAFQTGKLYLESGNLEKSRPYLQRAAELEPASGQIYRYLGDCYAANHNLEAATSAYKKAVKHNPHDAAALSALGSLFDDQGENPEISRMFLSESIKLSPDNGQYHYRLGRHFSGQNRLDEALKEFVKARSFGYDAADDIKTIKKRIRAEK